MAGLSLRALEMRNSNCESSVSTWAEPEGWISVAYVKSTYLVVLGGVRVVILDYACVDKAISALRSNGTLSSLQKKYLHIYLKVPVIKP